MNFRKKIIVSISAGLIVSVLFSVIGFAKQCGDIRSSVIRLHIVAASDSEEDQLLKLKVRDELLAGSPEVFEGSADINSACEKIRQSIPQLTQIAKKVITQNGYDYKVSVSLKKEFFTTRVYDDFTMPAGEYTALRVVIGEGRGHNWWCVIYPAMCLPAAEAESNAEEVLGSGSYKLISGSKYEPRFKIVEVIESIKNKLRRN